MLKIENLSKKFGDVYVLKDINLEVGKGEIHGLVGANGSGKSTLLNVLSGDRNIQNTGGYSGEVFVNGNKVNIKNTMSAISRGIGKVYQEFALVENMDIASNVKVNNENVYKLTKKVVTNDFAYINQNQNHKDAKGILNKFNIDIDTRKIVSDVSVNIKQFIEIAREIDKKDLKILLLDEPTACLNKDDALIFINVIKGLRDKGISIIFISHRLDEVENLCDRITVLRDGCVVSKYEKDEFDVEKIAIDMIGKKVLKTTKTNYLENTAHDNKKIISFNNLSIYDNNKVFENIKIDIYEGEMLGITSLAGHGHTMIPNSIIGMYKTKGNILYKGNILNLNTPYKTIQHGIVMIPEERKEMGILLDSSVKENIIFTSLYSKNNFLKLPKLKGLSFLDKKNINKCVDDYIKNFNIKCSSKNQLVKELSGGNQQKICIARALLTDPNVLFISEPTRGIDIYSKEIILKMLLEANKNNNTTIVISSSEIDELKRICDRIIVMYEGKVFEVLSPNEDNEVFGLAISGKRRVCYEKN